MPSTWSIHLEGPTGLDIPLEAPHAVVSRWLDIDHKAAVKPYAICPPVSVQGRTVIRVRLLDDSLVERLAAVAAPGTRVRLGRHWLRVAGRPALVARTAWAALGTGPSTRAWEVEFASPTTFRNRSRTSPFPSPDTVLTSLLSRWRRLHPATVPTAAGDAVHDVWVSDLEGGSEAIRMRDTVVSGFLGRVHYVCDGPQAATAAVDALMGFAGYAGIGSHTAYGLGTVHVRATWKRKQGEPLARLAASDG